MWPLFIGHCCKCPLKSGERQALPANRLASAYGLIFTPKVRTTEAEGVSVPMVALTVPAAPLAGAVIGLTGTVAAGLALRLSVHPLRGRLKSELL